MLILSEPHIAIEGWEKWITVKTTLNSRTLIHDIKINDPPHRLDFPQYLSVWIQNKLQPIFAALPLENVVMTATRPSLVGHELSINFNADLIANTNEALRKYINLAGMCSAFNDCLFINIGGDIRYKSFYEHLNDEAGNVHYMDIPSGFNRVTREWETISLPMSIEDLISFIKINRIGKIVSVNHYFIDRYAAILSVDLLYLLRMLGVQYFAITHDPFDLRPLGYLNKRCVLNGGATYFSGMSCLNEYWDQKMGMGVTYVPLPQDYRHSKQIKLDDDYDIIVLSNSRLGNVKALDEQIKMLFDAIPRSSLFIDIQLWYMACHYLLTEIMPLTMDQRLYYISILHQFFFAFLQYIKHVIINELKTDRTIKVYGDEGWKEICPQYYQGCLDNEGIERLYSETNHLYLLMNFSFSYLDASGPVYDVIRRGLPFVNVPPIVKTSNLEGLKHIEYSTMDELTPLVNDFNPMLNKPDLINALGICRDIYRTGTQSIVDKIRGVEMREVNQFQLGIQAHNDLIREAAKTYLYENELFVRATLNSFMGL